MHTKVTFNRNTVSFHFIIIILLSLVENYSFIFYSTTASSFLTSGYGAELTYADLEADGVLFPFQFSKSKFMGMADRMYTMPFYLYSHELIEVRFIILLKKKSIINSN